MAPLFTTSLLLLAATAHAHFKLNEPTSIGFSDDDEGTGPCGSFTPDFSKDTITDFHVDGQPIAMLSTHPETKWLFRATFAEKADGEWEQLYSIVDQQGIGDFCVPAVTAPKSWVGSTGVLSVVADATDGQLFQCASVKFVDGVGETGGNCKNGTNIKASVTTDSALAAMATATITPGSNSTSGGASTTSGSGAAATTTSAGGNAASGLEVPGSLLGAALFLVGAAFGW
ncbi:hypothetical protein F5X68DRAFT_30251 [Plectosphaerella plurivora]|uniref:Copper acquisition factor BIM1-like domain-containing protein n=1 Tax=Plectosphaerella plurivora TaxID=936078 RepID=A0A9P8VMQ0_9PEZI|nr:hypothetical protein F5X68DRAFT_30251 [Plectosphaerella plurivora]